RKRLKHRWENHFAEHEEKLRQREQELQAGSESLELERAALTEQRMRHNGEMELGRRKIDDDSRELALAQQQWESCLNQEKAESQQRAREMAEREAKVVRCEQEAAGQKQVWEKL